MDAAVSVVVVFVKKGGVAFGGSKDGYSIVYGNANG